MKAKQSRAASLLEDASPERRCRQRASAKSRQEQTKKMQQKLQEFVERLVSLVNAAQEVQAAHEELLSSEGSQE